MLTAGHQYTSRAFLRTLVSRFFLDQALATATMHPGNYLDCITRVNTHDGCDRFSSIRTTNRATVDLLPAFDNTDGKSLTASFSTGATVCARKHVVHSIDTGVFFNPQLAICDSQCSGKEYSQSTHGQQ